MSNYIIDYSIPLPGETKYNATVARKDVIRTFISVGAKFINWHPLLSVSIPKLRGLIEKTGDVSQAIIGLRNIKKGDNIYFQYPYLGHCLNLIVKLYRSKGAKVTLLIHDLEFLRYPDVNNVTNNQIRLLNSVDSLIVHTSMMKKRLNELGVTTPMKILTLFDYYAADPYRELEEQVADKNVIAFAGNLNKSIFLRSLDKSAILSSIRFRFYGIEPQNRFKNRQISYQGKFSPEHTSSLRAGWGLVWDGDSIDNCSGSLGNYLRFIAPHKLSLYLAAGMPVIVWNQSAHADFVKENNIGIAVNSIRESYSIIDNMTDGQYKEISINVRKIGEKLRVGGYLKEIINMTK